MSLREQSAVAYEVSQLDGPIVHCHCRTCRQAHASAFASTACVSRDHFGWVRGQDGVPSHGESGG